MKLNEGYRFVKSFKDLQTYVEYSGEEVATILEYNLPRKCRARFSNCFTPSRTKLPTDFFTEWNGKVSSFKKLFFGKYLTQEYFESDPTGVLYLSNRWAKHDPNMMDYSDVSKRYKTLMDTIREYKYRFRQCEDLDNYARYYSRW